MVQTLTFYHSLFRWLVWVSLIYGIFRAAKGYWSKSSFDKVDNSVRHWTATIAHIQLTIGIVLYSQSSVVKYFWTNSKATITNKDATFFGLIHIFLMLLAVVLITVGSALAKRKTAHHEKFKTMLVWFTVALFVIFIAIPWPFSPLANRPYLR